MYKELSFEERDELSIPEMKAILQQAALRKADESDRSWRNITLNAIKILSIAGKRGLYELVPELYKLIDHWDSNLRQPAVANLGWWLKVPEFKDRAYEIFMNDEDGHTASSALASWVSHYIDTKDAFVLEELYKALINDNLCIYVREAALSGIFEVIGIKSKFYDGYTSDLIKCHSPKEFNSKVEWKEVTELLRQYAPNALKNYPIQWTKADYEKQKNSAKEYAIILISKGWGMKLDL